MLAVLRAMWVAQGSFVAPRSARCLAAAPRLQSALQPLVIRPQYLSSTTNHGFSTTCAASAKDALRESNDSSSNFSSAAAADQAGDTRARIAQLLGVRMPTYCSGCGVKLQQTDPDGPGYFQVPRRLLDMAEQQAATLTGSSSSSSGVGQPQQKQQPSADERERRSIDAALEAWLDEQQQPAVPDLGGGSSSSSSSSSSGGSSSSGRQASVKCARCYSLVHYGKVKSEAAEGVLPAFDLANKVGRKISLQKDRKATVLCVVDVADFDGSLPRSALVSLFPGIGPDGPLPKDPQDLPFDLAVAVNKFDLLPTQATRQRVQQWVRTRLKQAGLPRPNRVFMVSAINGVGVKEMLQTLRADMGFRADLWVVGAQNAGKSSLIAAMRRAGGTTNTSSSSSSGSSGRDPDSTFSSSSSSSTADGDPTIAPIPGTTLGLLQVPGVPLGPKHRVFDTPGVPHPYQLTSRLNLRELAAVLPRRRLKPRTYCVPVGNSILIGGLARVDVVSGPSANLYVTVFVSDEIVTHMGKAAGAEERLERHVGGLLVPPYEPERLQELRLVPRTAVVEGQSWKEHSRDIAIAGLGWLAVGVSGSAELKVWVPEGVSVTLHDALIPDFAKVWQKPGFSAMLPQSAKKAAAAGGKQGSSSSRGAAARAASRGSSGGGSGSDSE